MPSILKTEARRVLKYLNKNGFDNIKLTVFIMKENSSLEQVVGLEQYFIDSLKPNLNVNLVASSSGYHEPMSKEIRDKLRKERGSKVFLYNANDLSLLYLFESKQHLYNSINIHHKTLTDCLESGNLYLDTYFFSLDEIEETNSALAKPAELETFSSARSAAKVSSSLPALCAPSSSPPAEATKEGVGYATFGRGRGALRPAGGSELLSLSEIQILVKNQRDLYKVKHPESKTIIAEFKDDTSPSRSCFAHQAAARPCLAKTLEFDSLNSLAKYLKGDRQVIREYLKGIKTGYYRGK